MDGFGETSYKLSRASVTSGRLSLRHFFCDTSRFTLIGTPSQLKRLPPHVVLERAPADAEVAGLDSAPF